MCVIGVPTRAIFDEPFNYTETTVSLSWRVHAALNAPIINYQLEFRELPRGHWIIVNIPADIISAEKGVKKHDLIEFTQSYTIKGLAKGLNYQVKDE